MNSNIIKEERKNCQDEDTFGCERTVEGKHPAERTYKTRDLRDETLFFPTIPYR